MNRRHDPRSLWKAETHDLRLLQPGPRSGRLPGVSIGMIAAAGSLVLLLVIGLVPASTSVSANAAGSSGARCSGVKVGPRADLQARIDRYPEGTTFCLKAGVYVLSTGVLVKSRDRIIGERGTVLNGQGVAAYGLYGFGGETGQKNVTVRGLVLKNFAGDAIKAGWNWVIRKNEVLTSKIGVRVNTGTVLRGNFIHHNRQYGLFAGPSTNDVLIENNELAYNNTSNSCGGACAGDAGGSKIVGSTEGTYGVTWRNNWVHDNTGNGIWSDGNVHNTLYEGNIVERNSDSGIDHEISWDATIRNNVVRNNAQSYLGKSCWYGAQILVNNSQGVQIYDNKVSSKAGANGICLVDATRNNVAPTPTFLADINVHHNIVRVSKSAMTGLVGNAANGVTFDWNTYYVPDFSGKYWAWYDRSPLDWTDFRMRGAEANGTRALSK